MDVRADYRVPADYCPAVEVGGGGVSEADAGEHLVFVDPLAQDRFRRGKLHPVVDAHDFERVGDRVGGAAEALFDGHADDIGQVLFTLGIVAAEPGYGSEEKLGRNAVDAGIDLADGPLLRGCVLFFDYCRYFAGAVFDDSAVAERVFEGCGEDRYGCLPLFVTLQQVPQGLGFRERHIAAEDQDIAAESLEKRGGAGNGVPGAVLLFLEGEGNIAAAGKMVAQRFRLMTDYHYGLRGGGLPGRTQRIFNQGGSGQGVHDLDELRFHSRALARRQDNCCYGFHGNILPTS